MDLKPVSKPQSFTCFSWSTFQNVNKWEKKQEKMDVARGMGEEG